MLRLDASKFLSVRVVNLIIVVVAAPSALEYPSNVLEFKSTFLHLL